MSSIKGSAVVWGRAGGGRVKLAPEPEEWRYEPNAMFYECNRVLAMLAQKRVPLGTQCFTGSTSLVEVMGSTGFDFVMFDSEHSGNDARAMEELVRTATFAGMASYIRVPDPHNATDVRRGRPAITSAALSSLQSATTAR
jgi:hypothetical protein